MTESPRRNLCGLSATFLIEATRANPHLADEAVLVHRSPLLARRQPGRLGPHLLDILQHHVAVAVKGLDASEELAVVATRDEDLSV